MQMPSPSDIKILMQPQSEPCISLLMPIYHVGEEIQQNPQRYKHLVKEAELHPRLQALPSAQREHLLKPLHKHITDPSLWTQPGEGLAIFRSPDQFSVYHLPIQIKEKLIVARHFSLKQLFPLLTDNGRFYILALSHKTIRLLEGTRFSIRAIPLPADVPTSMAETLHYPRPESQLQYHSGTVTASGARGERPNAIFHGQGGEADTDKEDLLRFFQHINRGMHAFLRNKKMPLVVASVEYLFPLYQQANTYPYLLPTAIPGNPDKQEPAKLQKQAWNVIAPALLQERQKAITAYTELANTEHATHNLSTIVSAACHGRIDTLFLTSDNEQWGFYENQTDTIQMHDQAQVDDEDLLEMAATQTFLHDGRVYTLADHEILDNQPATALFRY